MSAGTAPRRIGDPEPQVARVILHVEYEDGEVREFEAEKPHSLEFEVRHPELPVPLLRDPLTISPGDFTSVTLGFKANRDPRYPMTLRWAGDL